MKKQFVIWDPRGHQPLDEEGKLVALERRIGLVGRIGKDDAWLTARAEWTGAKKGGDRVRRHLDLEIGEWAGARFSLSGLDGWYQVWRVQ